MGLRADRSLSCSLCKHDSTVAQPGGPSMASARSPWYGSKPFVVLKVLQNGIIIGRNRQVTHCVYPFLIQRIRVDGDILSCELLRPPTVIVSAFLPPSPPPRCCRVFSPTLYQLDDISQYAMTADDLSLTSAVAVPEHTCESATRESRIFKFIDLRQTFAF
ncbi:hypothetical protein HYDPIDRAFT_114778 [Hydnomerulius pinastri MD-312]|uniref:Uncharacterized protein n=1 Tax=Hydnomerulius pinastri MD-312 TaxID=994086 RepID=A0A0C9VVV9_9AGAM|nr:hypothetical protein HYDPIDRAFT_114778 [Hydnomerulius pinastri MD-312]